MSNMIRNGPKVTVYIPCHNYGLYLREAIESVLQQSLENWELIIIDDGSTDDTAIIAHQFESQNKNKISILSNRSPCGIRECANMALRRARGEYIIRLDADDFLDESAFTVLAGYLDRHPEVALVYPNWTFVNEKGLPLGTEYRKRINLEDSLLDLPPHGACTMVRRRVLRSIGGYDISLDAQDGHELWLKVLNRYKVANVSTPLFFYRQHSSSLSRNDERLLKSRQELKRTLLKSNGGMVTPHSVAIIPAKNTYSYLTNIVLNNLVGKPLIDYTIEAALGLDVFECVYVFTDDPKVVKHCEKYANVLAEIRPGELSADRIKLSEVQVQAVNRLEIDHGIFPDIVALLSVHTPLRGPKHIREAIDTLILYDVDSVVSTYEDLDLHFKHGKNGMEPLNPGMIDQLRFEREALYVGNGAVHVTWRDSISPDSLFNGRIGHFVMPHHLSYYIKSPQDLVIVSAILENKSRNLLEH